MVRHGAAQQGAPRRMRIGTSTRTHWHAHTHRHAHMHGHAHTHGHVRAHTHGHWHDHTHAQAHLRARAHPSAPGSRQKADLEGLGSSRCASLVPSSPMASRVSVVDVFHSLRGGSSPISLISPISPIPLFPLFPRMPKCLHLKPS